MDIKIISSLEKCFIDDSIEDKKELGALTLFGCERASFQVAYKNVEEPRSIPLRLKVDSDAIDAVRLYTVESVPSIMPDLINRDTDLTIRTSPGLYPDLLRPYENGGLLFRSSYFLSAVWVELDGANIAPGKHEIKFTFTDIDGNEMKTVRFEFTRLPQTLPEVDFKFTQWFHCDSLCDAYKVEMFSDEHWVILENYLRAAVGFGINMILTPIFTPPLDTLVGGERMTAQLIGVEYDGTRYRFDFTLLGKWIALCLDCGVKYFEIAHLFTQWGAKHAPKIMATVGGEYKRIFGWETDAAGEEYAAFLEELLPALTGYLRAVGVYDKCYFHISDEPSKEHFESYMKAKANVVGYLDETRIMDALSEYEFYDSGACKMPIPRDLHIDKFLENNVPELWTYFCMRPSIAARASVMRIYGALFYKFNIVGFLEWGYNFYYSCNSVRYVDPYRDTTGEMFVPSGDNFVVYPGDDGMPYPSMRAFTFLEGLQDMRALKLCEQLRGREFTLALIEDTLGSPLEFNKYPEDDDFTRALREKVNAAIAES